MDLNGETGRFAERLRMAVIALMVAVSGLHLVARTSGWLGPLRIVSADHAGTGPAFAFLSDVSTALFVAALWRMTQMLRAVGGQAPFAAEVTSRFRGFALLLLLSALVSALGPPLAGIALHLVGPHRQVLVPFDMRDLWTLCVAGLLFLVARLFERARAIEADLSEIV